MARVNGVIPIMAISKDKVSRDTKPGSMSRYEQIPDGKVPESMNKNTKAKYQKPNPVRGCIARFPRAILAVTGISEPGAEKHGVPLDDMSFKHIPDAYNVFREAQVRHMIGEAMDGPTDPDFNRLHIAHEAWDALAKLEIRLKEIDDKFGRAAMMAVINGERTYEYFTDPHPELGKTGNELAGEYPVRNWHSNR